MALPFFYASWLIYRKVSGILIINYSYFSHFVCIASINTNNSESIYSRNCLYAMCTDKKDKNIVIIEYKNIIKKEPDVIKYDKNFKQNEYDIKK